LSSEQPIGIFDSGIGGLTVAHEINKLLPNEQIIYFGDTQHLPYGDKSHSKITYYSEKIVDFLLQKKCKAIIIACNSASSVALKHLVKKTQKSCVIFNVIDPLIKAISNDKKIKNIGVIGTNATIYSGVYEQYIYQVRPDIKTYSLATPILASLIEEDNEKLYTSGVIESYLSHKVFNSIDTLILGCTHYPLIESKIKDFYQKKIKIISSLNYIGNHVKDILSNLNLLNKSVETTSKYSFYVSDYTDNFQKKTKIFFPTSIILEEENIFS
tara:strand:+ start:2548 stop:3357 length:810 start_codon:yes stop_codon:yes gene_type:complete